MRENPGHAADGSDVGMYGMRTRLLLGTHWKGNMTDSERAAHELYRAAEVVKEKEIGRPLTSGESIRLAAGMCRSVAPKLIGWTVDYQVLP